MVMIRTHKCGEIRPIHIGQTVKAAGWVQRVRDLGGLLFLDLRDRYGLIQVVINPQNQPELAARTRKIPRESVVSIEGKVQPRPKEMINEDMATGEVEISPSNIKILSECGELPIPFEEVVDAGEELRLKYRYLELRRPHMLAILEKRHLMSQTVRSHLDSRGFLEIETPFLMKSTPEGARDFLVPSRINPGRFYALPQSPQTYKQILMVAGIDKYFQLVRCFRDEDFRADRQPEFTQIDLEMSFVDEEDVFAEVEGLMAEIFRRVVGIENLTPFPRITYEEAIAYYGTDKPDIRFGWKLRDVSSLLGGHGFKIFDSALESGGVITALPMSGVELSRKQVDEVNQLARECGLPGIVAGKWDGTNFNAPLSKFMPPEKSRRLAEILFENQTGTALFAAGDRKPVLESLGELRLKLAERFEPEKADGFHCLWVTDFPLFEQSSDGEIVPSHHPFTAPVEGDLPLLKDSPFRVRSRAYDLVLNGVEIASGSIRIHERALQERIFSRLGISREEANDKFGFLLKAFEYGVPPHGGIAFGFDRLLMILCGGDSIREVIPFPKTTSGLSLMDGSPAVVADQQLKELGIEIRSKTD